MTNFARSPFSASSRMLAAGGLAFILASGGCGNSSGGDQGAAPEPLPVVETTTTSEATTTVLISTVDVDRYCELVTDSDAASVTFFLGDDSSDPEKMREFAISLQASTVEAFEVADLAIKEDVALLVEEMDDFAVVLYANDYDVIAAFDYLATQPDSPARIAANEAVNAYNEVTCGSQSDGSTTGEIDIALEEAELIMELLQTPDGFDLVVQNFTQELPDLSIEQSECFVSGLTAKHWIALSSFAGVNREDLDISDTGVQEVLALMGNCDIPLVVMMPDAS